MKLVTFLVIMSTIPLASSLKFLFIPGPATSHCLEVMSIAGELLKRGHKVTLLAHLFNPQPCLKRSSHNSPNFKVVSPDVGPEVKENHEQLFGVATKTTIGSSNRFLFAMTAIKPAIANLCESLLSDRKLLLELNKDGYDLALIEGLPFTSCMFSIAVHLEIPYAAISSLFDPTDTGIPFQANIIPHFLAPFDNRMTFVQRILSSLMFLVSPLGKVLVLPSLDLSAYSSKLKGVDTRYLIRDSVLFIENSDYFFDYPMAVLPNYIQAGGLSAELPSPLPADLKSFIEGASEGVVLVTFGSVLRDIPPEVVEKILKGFQNLRQRVVFKHDSDGIDGNIKMMKWLPQNDVLGHPNVKLFVSHCGKNGVWEGIYHAVPIICTPFGADAVTSGFKVKRYEVGTTVDLIGISSDDLTNLLQTVLSNKQIYKNMEKLSAMLRDRPETAPQRAASALEHVAKYGGEHMRPSEISFFSWIYADLWLTVIAMVWFVYFILRRLCRLCCNRSQQKKKTE